MYKLLQYTTPQHTTYNIQHHNATKNKSKLEQKKTEQNTIVLVM